VHILVDDLDNAVVAGARRQGGGGSDGVRRRGPARCSPRDRNNGLAVSLSNLQDLQEALTLEAGEAGALGLESVLEVSASSLGRGVTSAIDCQADL
jgi:hypothetical protein